MANTRSPDDIVVLAWVEDMTQKFFDQFDQRVNKLESNVSQGFQKVDNTVKSSGLSLGIIGGVVGGLTNKFLEMGFQAAQSLRGIIVESTMLAARAETLGVSLELIGKNAGYSSAQMKEYETGLRKTGITILAARQSLAQMVQANLDITQSAKLARVAQDAAVIAGVNSSEAFQRILHGITTTQPEILRSLGLVVNMQQEIEKFAKANNRSAESITYTEKQQIALNATLEAGKKISGAYEAAMTTVGKKLNSLQRYSEDLKIELGKAFTPALGVVVDAITEALKNMNQWLVDNADAVEFFGERLAIVAQTAVEWIGKIAQFVGNLPGMIVDTAGKLAQLISVMDTGIDDISDAELEKRIANLGEYFAQAVSVAAGGATYILEFTKQIIDAIVLLAKSAAAAWSGDFEGAAEIGIQAGQAIIDAHGKASEAADAAFLSTAKFTGAIRESGDAASDAAPKMGDYSTAIQGIMNQMQAVTDALAAFNKKMQDDLAEQAIQSARQATEAALRESWEQEDLARQHAERVAEIMQGAAEARQEAMQRYAQQRIDLEVDYQRRLRDIQRSFEFDASELARNRDAIGLVRLMRQHNKQLEDERIAQNDRREDAAKAYQRELKELDARRRKALQDLAKQEAREAEVRARSLARQRELQALHDKWAEEDRKRKYAKELADLLRQHAIISTLTQAQLNSLFGQWGSYFQGLLQMAYSYMTAVGSAMTFGGNGPGGALGGSYGGYSNTASAAVAAASGGGGGGGSGAAGIVGQAGQVSWMLADGSRWQDVGMSRVPAVSPSSSASNRQSRDISVKVEGAGLDPYIQRVVVRSLLEIERNKNG